MIAQQATHVHLGQTADLAFNSNRSHVNSHHGNHVHLNRVGPEFNSKNSQVNSEDVNRVHLIRVAKEFVQITQMTHVLYSVWVLYACIFNSIL